MAKRILVTRAPHQASALAEALRVRGLEPILIPTIEIAAPASFEPLDAAIANLKDFHWLIFTSANAVEAFAERLSLCPQGLKPKVVGGLLGTAEAVPYRTAISQSSDTCSIAAIGPATARAVRRLLGAEPALIPTLAVAESLAEGLLPYARQPEGASTKFLLVRAEQARDMLPDTLLAAGANVSCVPAYRNVVPASSIFALRALFATPANYPDAITFTSSSTATNLKLLLDDARISLPDSILRVSIGPVTSQTMRDLEMTPHAEAVAATVEALADAVAEALKTSR